MATQGDTNRAGFRLVRRLALPAMIAAIVGLPVNHLFGYALLSLAILFAFAGEVTPQARRWLAAALVSAAVVAGQFILAAPRIEEGHNVFLPGGTDNALTAGLPPDVYRIMAAQFDALYPPAQRCDPKQPGCWQSAPMPDRTFAFSADGIFDKPEFSRRVDGIDFIDPVWLRLGFINEFRYNWTPKPGDLERARRDRRFWMGLHRWHLLMPYFVMVRLPAEFTGGQLCWRGDIVWEEGADRFTLLNQFAWGCRVIEKKDAGRRIFGLGIRPDTLAMKLEPPAALWLQQMAAGALTLVGAGAVIGLLARWRMRALLLPVLLAGAAFLSIAVDDASFIGGVRPFDGGDDGLYYDGAARRILLHLLDGNLLQAIEGGEKVFYYGGPGFRYLRALEHIAFGETYLGSLALILFLPIAVFGIFQRFLPRIWALASAIVFVAIPVGAVFGTSFFLYAKNAARGYGDPAAAIFALCGTLLLAGLTSNGPGRRFAPAFGAALLLALAIFVRPNLAPFVGIVLGGAGLFALYSREWMRCFGLCLGFLPAAFMPWHNWYFGGAFVLFSANAANSELLVMPPQAYAAALGELVRFDFMGEHLVRAARQLVQWLSLPSEMWLSLPFNAAAIAVLIVVAIRGRTFDPWLRLIAFATLVQHGVALFYAATPRYHLLTWLMTLVIVTAWAKYNGVSWVRGRWPRLYDLAAAHPFATALGSLLRKLERATGADEHAIGPVQA